MISFLGVLQICQKRLLPSLYLYIYLLAYVCSGAAGRNYVEFNVRDF